MTEEDVTPEYHSIEKVFHVGRRRRLVRTRICMDQKLQKFFLQGAVSMGKLNWHLRPKLSFWTQVLHFRTWASADNFPWRETSTFCFYCSYSWRGNANARSQNALPFLHHNENASCYGNSRKNRASSAQQCFFFIHVPFHAVQNYEAYRYQQSLSRSIFCQRCL